MAEPGDNADVLPSHTALYLEPTYWNDRFAREEHYEWFKDYSHFRHLILANVKPTDRVLEVGCGNSQMGVEMFKDGICQITRTDLSPVAVKHMQERSAALGFEGIRHEVADMLDLPFEDGSFDVVIEKGTLPHFRRPHFEAEGLSWSMKWATFGDSFHYFFYTLRKGTKEINQGPTSSIHTGGKFTFDLDHEFMDNEDFLLRSSIGDDD
ncbi:hypothetical protein AXG93_1217s1150 [Marchantia polymorpha subsp. ruderalis]|uniref:Methyltransferase domain-containing protein n=1 Tax=Marchantia polymorpha subsp. ruderalis TaxID=1480154 RepID=A0A176VU07_MARPO|nr:hypothetical protein AXG93_1217s1150 [Marchantia polymorpha subsp. ruderalis]